jgi:hypothetical protein
MTNAGVQHMIAKFNSRGRSLSPSQAATYLLAVETLQHTPDHEPAAEVISNYASYLVNGEMPVSFAEFLLPIGYTDEQKAESSRIRAEHLRAVGRESEI